MVNLIMNAVGTVFHYLGWWLVVVVRGCATSHGGSLENFSERQNMTFFFTWNLLSVSA